MLDAFHELTNTCSLHQSASLRVEQKTILNFSKAQQSPRRTRKSNSKKQQQFATALWREHPNNKAPKRKKGVDTRDNKANYENKIAMIGGRSDGRGGKGYRNLFSVSAQGKWRPPPQLLDYSTLLLRA